MALNIVKEVAALRRMTPRELQEKYAEVFGEPTRSFHKQYLVKRIAWRMQANEEGDLPERARRRAMELADDTQLRRLAPKVAEKTPARARTDTKRVRFVGDRRLPLPGAVITRPYKGETLRVTVLDDGFEYAGERFRSLSAVAKHITGTHCNGYHFFRLGGNGRAK
jgi:hypothetical protein